MGSGLRGPLVSVTKAFDLLTNPGFIVWEVAELFGTMLSSQ